MFRRRKRPDYDHIAELESALGYTLRDMETAPAQPPRKNPKWRERGGVVEIRPIVPSHSVTAYAVHKRTFC